eukprot:3164444-Prymnesium_polylepis.2
MAAAAACKWRTRCRRCSRECRNRNCPHSSNRSRHCLRSNQSDTAGTGTARSAGRNSVRLPRCSPRSSQSRHTCPRSRLVRSCPHANCRHPTGKRIRFPAMCRSRPNPAASHERG